MRSHATKVDYDKPLLEIVGTGGDKAGSFNISTTAALVIAAGGAKVAKHGNRAASSKSGTADCQEALGVNIEQSPELCKKLLEEVGMCFFFAQKYHTAMRYVGPIRKELGFRTVFNILGPLTNPASPDKMILGVYDESLVQPLAHVLVSLGVKDGMVVYGQDCLDELSTACPTTVCEFHGDDYLSYVLTPDELGMKRCVKEDLQGGSPEENAQITRDILFGKEMGSQARHRFAERCCGPLHCRVGALVEGWRCKSPGTYRQRQSGRNAGVVHSSIKSGGLSDHP